MKTRLFAIMFAVMMFLVLSASISNAQNSQAIKVEVRFAFTANNTIHPAGTYRIEPAGASRAIWRLRGSRIRRNEFLLALSLGGSSRGDLRVTFHRYGNKQFLAGFKTPSYEVSLPVSRREKMVRQEAQEASVQDEVIHLETAAAGGSR